MSFSTQVTITTRLLVSHLSGIRHYEKDITKVKEEKEKANRVFKQTKDKEQKEKEGKEIEKTDSAKLRKEHEGEVKSRNSKPGGKDKEFEQEEYYLKEKFESVFESLKIFKNDPLFFKPGEFLFIWTKICVLFWFFYYSCPIKSSTEAYWGCSTQTIW